MSKTIGYQKKEFAERPKSVSVEKAQGTFKSFWQGTTVDAAGNKRLNGVPALFDTKYGDKVKQARYTLRSVIGGTEYEYNGSLFMSELPVFANAFGIKPAQYAALVDPASEEATLLNLQARLIMGHQVVTFDATDKTGQGAWIDRIHQMTVPDGSYYGKFVGFSSKNPKGLSTWKERPNKKSGKMDKYAYFNMEILSGDLATIRVPGSLYYAPEVDEDGDVTFHITSKGPSASTKRFIDFVVAIGAGNLNDNGELVLPDNVEDANNILPELETAALAAGVVCLFEVSNGWVAREGVNPLPAGSLPPSNKTEVLEKSKAAKLFYDMLTERMGGVKPFKTDGTYTDEAVAWLREHVKPICKEHNIPAKVTEMTGSQIALILGALNDPRMDEAVKIAEEESNDGEF